MSYCVITYSAGSLSIVSKISKIVQPEMKYIKPGKLTIYISKINTGAYSVPLTSNLNTI